MHDMIIIRLCLGIYVSALFENLWRDDAGLRKPPSSYGPASVIDR